MPSACSKLLASSTQHAPPSNMHQSLSLQLDWIRLVCRYLGPVGDGVSAQVVLAQDELRPGSPPVVLKVMRRHLAAAGQKVLSSIPFDLGGSVWCGSAEAAAVRLKATQTKQRCWCCDG